MWAEQLVALRKCPDIKWPLFDRTLSCAVIGNSSTILDHYDGAEIDSYDQIIRCNWAIAAGFEAHVGSRTDIRFLNSHNFWCTTPDWASTESMEKRFELFDRNFIYTLRDEAIVIKKQIPTDVFAQQLSFMRDHGCRILHLYPGFHNICNNMVGGAEATTGLVAILLAVKHYKNVGCFGFRFSENGEYHHYFERIEQYNQDCHRFDKERELMEWLDEKGHIQLR